MANQEQVKYLPIYNGPDSAGRAWEIQIRIDKCKLWHRKVWYSLHCKFVGPNAQLLGYLPFGAVKQRRVFYLESDGFQVPRQRASRDAEVACPELLPLVNWLAKTNAWASYEIEEAKQAQVAPVTEEEEAALIWTPPVENK